MLFVYQRPLLICLTQSHDDNFHFPGHNVVRASHPSITKKAGVCIYLKNPLPLKVLDIQLLQECMNFEIKIADKT